MMAAVTDVLNPAHPHGFPLVASDRQYSAAQPHG
jgi:hypothetical protein